jgi:hypothetical protein
VIRDRLWDQGRPQDDSTIDLLWHALGGRSPAIAVAARDLQDEPPAAPARGRGELEVELYFLSTPPPRPDRRPRDRRRDRRRRATSADPGMYAMLELAWGCCSTVRLGIGTRCRAEAPPRATTSSATRFTMLGSRSGACSSRATRTCTAGSRRSSRRSSTRRSSRPATSRQRSTHRRHDRRVIPGPRCAGALWRRRGGDRRFGHGQDRVTAGKDRIVPVRSSIATAPGAQLLSSAGRRARGRRERDIRIVQRAMRGGDLVHRSRSAAADSIVAEAGGRSRTSPSKES